MKSFKKLKIHRPLSVATIAVGVIFLIYGAYVEDDPNLISPLLIACGAGWYFITRARIRSQHEIDDQRGIG